ncbi:MAG: PEP-CTERM sorting domain-containing protein [Phycisphaerales bacterium]|nr:PEP-CTERM sorting domain-containing protein [Phycisphaerales bacterium]
MRPDAIRTWHIFSDTVNDGILNPGDTRIGEFQNWWTPESAGTQHGHEIGAPPAAGDEYPSTPIDHQANYTTNKVQGLPQKAGTIGFYMTYSHLDNADYVSEFTNDGGTPPATLMQRNYERNGYAMGWLTGQTVVDSKGAVDLGTNTGNVKMDIFVHAGKSDNAPGGRDNNINFGAGSSTISRSDPQVAQSNDMNLRARQNDNMMLVPDYRDDSYISDPTRADGFTYGGNDGYVYDGFNGGTAALNGGTPGPIGGKYLVDGDFNTATPTTLATESQFDAVVASMDVREVNAYTNGATPELNGLAPIHAADSPQALLNAGVTDGLGQNLYFYEDAFMQRDGSAGGNLNDGAQWIEGSTDGGVIAGLSGYDDYSQYFPGDQRLNTHWAEQQVIRIDFDKASFDKDALVGISEIIFYDWGATDPLTGQQTNPIAITINVDASQNLYFDDNGTKIYFPDNRIYIAQVGHAPEPASMILLAAGASALLARRKRRQK